MKTNYPQKYIEENKTKSKFLFKSSTFKGSRKETFIFSREGQKGYLTARLVQFSSAF